MKGGASSDRDDIIGGPNRGADKSGHGRKALLQTARYCAPRTFH